MCGKISIAFIVTILFIGLGFVVTSCAEWPGQYAPPKLIPLDKPNPQEDFIKLGELFKAFGGNLVTKDDEIVRWKDTKMFRLFEFKHHTVVIFPYNWDKNKFDLILFAGHIKNYDNVFDSVFYKYKPNHETKIYYYNETMNLNPRESRVNEVTIGGFYFGEDKSKIVTEQSRLIEAEWPEEQQKQIRLTSLMSYPNESSGENKNFNFHLFFENNKLAYMNIYSPNVPKLGGYKIQEPKTPVIAEGEFAIHLQK